LTVIDIPAPGATIAVDDTGEGVPVLLLHGFPATRHLWSRVAPLMRDAGFRLLIPDLVGYGGSDAPAGVRIDMASQASWMLALLDALGIARVAGSGSRRGFGCRTTHGRHRGAPRSCPGGTRWRVRE
jgi:haloacetate dehalogenase